MIVNTLVKMLIQCVAAVKEANSMLVIIRKGMENKSVHDISAVHLHGEYGIQFWLPFFLKKRI